MAPARCSTATGLAAVALTLGILAFVTSCAPPPPDTATVEALTDGVWHAVVGEDDYLYELRLADGRLGGRLHRVTDGKQINEIPVGKVSLKGEAIELENLGFASYKGRINLEQGLIEGGAPRAPAFRQMNLRREAAERWPMLQIRSPSDPSPADAAGSHPEETGDGWATATPSDVQIDPGAVERTLRAVLAGEAAALHSLLVVRGGRMVLEEYFHGWGREDVHHIASCTKSVASLLVGIAIDQGLVSGVDTPLLEFFPGRSQTAEGDWHQVRLEHLLTMTMGLDWGPGEANRWPLPGDVWAQALERSVTVPPGTRFLYGGRDVNLLSGVLLEATGVEADAFAAEHLFAPLGITSWDWEYHRWQGHPEMAAALKLRPRDMAKIGQLVLDEGTWRGELVISSGWIRESTRAHVADTGHDTEYGYLWWRIPDSALGSVPFANGMGSNLIFVLPEVDMVVVTTGGNDFNRRQFDIVDLLERSLAPGVHQASP